MLLLLLTWSDGTKLMVCVCLPGLWMAVAVPAQALPVPPGGFRMERASSEIWSITHTWINGLFLGDDLQETVELEPLRRWISVTSFNCLPSFFHFFPTCDVKTPDLNVDC